MSESETETAKGTGRGRPSLSEATAEKIAGQLSQVLRGMAATSARVDEIEKRLVKIEGLASKLEQLIDSLTRLNERSTPPGGR